MEILEWNRAQPASSVGNDGRFILGVFTVRRRLGRYDLAFLANTEFTKVLESPEDKSIRQAFLDRKYDSPDDAKLVAEGLAEGLLLRVKPEGSETGDFVIDSIERLLRERNSKLSKSEIMALLHITEPQWQAFSRRRPKSVRFESHGRGAKYWYEAPKSDARRPPPESSPSKDAKDRSHEGQADPVVPPPRGPGAPPRATAPGSRRLSDYVGHATSVARLQRYVDAALKRGQPLDHVLLSGPSGVGKTTLAHTIADELGKPFHVFWGPTLTSVQATLSQVPPGDVIFIDEIHALSHASQEELYAIMATPITVIGATNYPGDLVTALRGRFGIKEPLKPYDNDALVEILRRVAEADDIPLPDEVALAIARRSRGSAREAISLSRRLRDLDGLTPDRVDKAFADLEVDDIGLNDLDRRYLAVLAESEDPVGVDTIATALGESVEAIESVVEPFLLQRALIERTRMGRKLSAAGRKYLSRRKPGKGSRTGEQADLPLEDTP